MQNIIKEGMKDTEYPLYIVVHKKHIDLTSVSKEIKASLAPLRFIAQDEAQSKGPIIYVAGGQHRVEAARRLQRIFEEELNIIRKARLEALAQQAKLKRPMGREASQSWQAKVEAATNRHTRIAGWTVKVFSYGEPILKGSRLCIIH